MRAPPPAALLLALAAGTVVARAAGLQGVVAAKPPHGPELIVKQGIYAYFTDESSPLVFNGQLLMFESIVRASPEFNVTAFPSCACYYRIRDVRAGSIVANIPQSCNHAFGAATVLRGDGGLDTLYAFGTPWSRYNAEAPGDGGDASGGGLAWPPWSGPCKNATCVVDAFWSSDPALQQWSSRSPAAVPVRSVYNVDVAAVGAPSSALATTRRAAAGLPAGTFFVMVLETSQEFATFAVSNSSDPTSPDSWTFLPAPLPKFGNGQVGSCPSVRYDPASGYFYVLTGGASVYMLRSTDLQNWTLADGGGLLLAPDANDCVIAPAAYGNYTPSAEAAGHIAKCTGAGFGNDSDIDLTEAIIDGAVVTLFQYGSGDQATFGFSNLAVANGRMFDVLASYFGS